MKPGYLYVLIHPSDPNLYKIGQTTLDPAKRLAQHNTNYKKYAGQIVKETGQKWQIKTYIEVQDPYWAESVFWGSTPLAHIPFLGGIEVQTMKWEWVEKGLEAAKRAGWSPPAKLLPDWVYSYTKWMRERLAGRDITLIGYVKSRCSGTATFLCSNNHEWKTRVLFVAEGEGCPVCGIGERTPEEMKSIVKPAYLLLLIHPDNPGFIKVILADTKSYKFCEENDNSGWEIHRYADVEEGPFLAESIIWDLIGIPRPSVNDQAEIDLSIAEQAFRKLIYRLREKIALLEKENDKNSN